MSEAFGLPVTEIPDSVTPLEVVGAVKVLNEEGELELWGFQTQNVTFWEATGMLQTALREFDANVTLINFHHEVEDEQ
ncbi:MAG: hypothetical protein ACO3O7_05720 [Ilumatobacteraceae bacterium]